MNFNPKIFHSYDIRGEDTVDLNPEIYLKIGQIFGNYLLSKNIQLCPVGRDNRIYSPIYAKALIHGLNQSGVNTIDLGETTSPIVYFASYLFKTPACAMVTSSHLPKNTNGLKINDNYSEPVSAETLQYIKESLIKDFPLSGKGSNITQDISEKYLEQIKKHFSLQKNWKISLDGLNGAAGKIYSQVISSFDFIQNATNIIPDSNFPLGTPDPLIVSHQERLSKMVSSNGSDLGVSFDADGDRLAVVDNLGRPINMSKIQALLAKGILEKYPNSTIVSNNLSGPILRSVVENNGGKLVIAKTGRAFIKEAIERNHASFGSEFSGHIYFSKDYFGHDDPLFALFFLLSLLEKWHLSLSEAVDSLPKYFSSSEIRVYLKSKDQLKYFSDNQQTILNEIQLSPSDTQDGYTFIENDKYLVIRPSQNDHYLVVRIDSASEAGFLDLKKIIKRLIAKLPDIDLQKSENLSELG